MISSLDCKFMKLAIGLAAKGKPSPNPRVGCVITQFGFVVGRGYHQARGMPHAELDALKEAGKLARYATLYVNLEPCAHYGRTPPCVDAIIKAGIRKVVIAMKDPNPLVNGAGIRKLEQAGIKVKVGVMEEEARQLNERWIKYITTKRPFVTLKAAVSLDGRIATKSGDSKWISNSKSRHLAHILRDRHDAIIIGINTVLADNPQLTARIRDGRNPLRIILDSNLRVPLYANVLNDQRVLIVTTRNCNAGKKAELEKKKHEILFVDEDRIRLKPLMEELGKREVTSVLVEGGSEVHASALKEGIVDKVVFVIAPKIIGGREAKAAVGGEGITMISEALSLSNVRVKQLGDNVVVEGYLQ